MPNLQLSRKEPDLSFAKFSYTRRKLALRHVREINRLIVRSAEDCVFFRDQRAWIADFIRKNRYYRIETVTRDVADGTGTALWFSQRLVSRHPN
jgi:hypothetical protein